MTPSCEVCGRAPSVDEVGSLLDGSRHAYCLPCLKAEAEPYPVLVQALAMDRDRGVAELAQAVTGATLRAAGKCRAQLDADVARLKRTWRGLE